MKLRISALLLALFLMVFSMPVFAQDTGSEDIVILYENDVHCAVDGYAKLKAMKDELLQTADYVGVVSVGDFVQGSSLGAISQGEYIVNIMNLVGYDAVTLGNHEFDYRISRLLQLVDMMDTKPVCSNFEKISESKTVFEPYTIVSYGEIDIAYIGITTPDTMTSSSPAQFLDQNGDYAYTFNGNDLYDTVQASIDAAEKDGAEYIVALLHLGTEDVFEKWSAQTLIKNTTGLDVVLDGHSHSVVENMTVIDEGGNEVVVTSTGTQFANIGKLTISDGKIKTELIPTENYEKTDSVVADYIAKIREEYSTLGERKIGESKVNLTTVDKDGNRIIRNAETNLGDFCADAFRVVTGADIGFMNGGGIRANMDSGDVTFNDILSVFPFNNTVCVVEVTGQQIVDMLELGVINYPNEDGSFQHVSGITFDLNGSIDSSVKLDENMVFVSVEGQRRVSNVKVLNKTSGQYEPIELTKTYTLASHNYLLLEQGGGASMFKDAKVVKNDGMLDVEMLEIYIVDNLGSVIGEEYAVSQNRINIVTNTPTTTTTETTTTIGQSESTTVTESTKETEKTRTQEKSSKNTAADTDDTSKYTLNSNEKSPKTGEGSSMDLWVALMCASMIIIATTARSKKNDC